jgi:NhaA family Na+:H+ antiporter
MPLFALANAGVVLSGDIIANIFSSTITLGVLLGLTIGKFSGVVLFSWLMIKFRFSSMPEGMSWGQLMGLSCLAGVGFTMSLFVTTLAFEDSGVVDDSKIGILAASLIAGVAGYVVLRKTSVTPTPLEP